MKAITVDDESWALKTLTRAVESSKDISSVESFSSCSRALEWAGENSFDIAFLDVNMRGIGGIELARQLRLINPRCFIIFCTGFSEYAIEAFRLHADGYLLKPIEEKQVQEELDHILSKNASAPLLEIRCFGGFEVCDGNGKRLVFKRNKSRELLALLVDKKGMGITAREMCTYLWEDESGSDKKNLQYLWNVLSDLTKTLKNAGAGDVLIHSGTYYSIDMDKVGCDYYDYLKGKKKDVDIESYLPQYSWAEYSIANLRN